MAIDVSRVKRTSGGHDVRIYAIDAGGKYPIHGAYKRDYQWCIRMWTASGIDEAGVDNALDLIEEPQTVELDCWVNVYADATGAAWETKEEADRNASGGRFACINIKKTVTEGEGL